MLSVDHMLIISCDKKLAMRYTNSLKMSVYNS